MGNREKEVKRPKLSACMVVYHEEDIIEQCLKSIVDVVDEIVVVHDGPCSDRTVDIAKQYGAKVIIPEKRHGSSEGGRVITFENATGDWILVIDADEFLPPALQKEIPKLIKREDIDAFAFNWPYWDGKRYIRGAVSIHPRPILYRKSKMYFLAITHEAAKTFGKTEKRMDLMLEHRPRYNKYSFKNLRTKWFRWNDLQAKEIMHVREAPSFNMENQEADYVKNIYAYYDEIIAHPYISLIRRNIINQFIKYLLFRGLLWSEPVNWKIILIEYISSIYLAHRIRIEKRLLKQNISSQ